MIKEEKIERKGKRTKEIIFLIFNI